MTQPLVIAGAKCRIFINNICYSVSQSVSVEVDNGTYSIYGINAPYAQEVGSGQVSIRGSIRGIRTRSSGGLQGINAIPLFSNIASGNYVSIRLEDRQSGETLWSCPKCRVSKISETVQTKGLYFISFDFIAQMIYYPLDLI